MERLLTTGPADRLLIYLILFISDCLSKLAPVAGRPSPTYGEAGKKLATLAVDNFALPGEPGFPLNSMYHPPANRSEAGEWEGNGGRGVGGGRYRCRARRTTRFNNHLLLTSTKTTPKTSMLTHRPAQVVPHPSTQRACRTPGRAPVPARGAARPRRPTNRPGGAAPDRAEQVVDVVPEAPVHELLSVIGGV